MTLLHEPDLRDTARDALVQLVGTKAADYLECIWTYSDVGAHFPRCDFLSTVFLDELYRDRAAPEVDPVPEAPALLPRHDDVPAAAARLGADAAQALLEQELWPGDMASAFVRTSLVWQGGGRPPFPGIDSRATIVDGGARLPLLAQMVSELYRAYTTFCFELAGLPVVDARPAGMMFSEVVDAVNMEGVAFIWEDAIRIDASSARWGPICAQDHRAFVQATMDPQSARSIGRILDGIREHRKPGSLLEAEFLIDSSERFHLVQVRQLSDVEAPSLGRPGMVFHTPGSAAGRVVDLRNVTRHGADTFEVLAEASGPGRILVVRDIHHDVLDGFAVGSAICRGHVPAPDAIILTYGKNSHTGMPTHLRWTLAAALPQLLLLRVPEPEAPTSGAVVRVETDGVDVQIVAA